MTKGSGYHHNSSLRYTAPIKTFPSTTFIFSSSYCKTFMLAYFYHWMVYNMTSDPIPTLGSDRIICLLRSSSSGSWLLSPYL